MRSIPHMGHRFGPLLLCDCGQCWEAHQETPAECHAAHTDNHFQAGMISSLCRRHGVTKRSIAEAVGFSTRTVLLAFQDNSSLTDATKVEIMRVAKEMLDAKGVAL